MSTADELGKLAALRDQGVLTQNEFEARKQSILSQDRPEGRAPKTISKRRRRISRFVIIIAVGYGIYALGSYIADNGRVEQARLSAAKEAELHALMPSGEKEFLVCDPAGP